MSYNSTDGSLIGVQSCKGGVGRGSIKVVQGCCRFWDDISGDNTCTVGEPYLGLRVGECKNEGEFKGFKCVSCCLSSVLIYAKTDCADSGIHRLTFLTHAPEAMSPDPDELSQQ